MSSSMPIFTTPSETFSWACATNAHTSVSAAPVAITADFFIVTSGGLSGAIATIALRHPIESPSLTTRWPKHLRSPAFEGGQGNPDLSEENDGKILVTCRAGRTPRLGPKTTGWTATPGSLTQVEHDRDARRTEVNW